MAREMTRKMARQPRRNSNTTSAAGRRVSNGYQRGRDLPRLLPMMASEMETPTLAEHVRLLALIRRALRRERCRGVGGHWTYDLARHAALLAAFRAERAAVAERIASQRSDVVCGVVG